MSGEGGGWVVWADKKTVSACALLPAAWLLGQTASSRPVLVETIYSQGFYPLIGQTVSTLSGGIPFSLGEIAVITAVIAGVAACCRWTRRLVGGEWQRPGWLQRLVKSVLAGAGLLYLAFLLCWGLNYYRLPFAQTAGLAVRPASVQELAAVTRSMVKQANLLRLQVAEDQQGVARLSGDAADALRRAGEGYRSAAEAYPALAGSFGLPKPVFISRVMTYTGITGVYFPFTGEANVNTWVPAVTLPFTACHEMAHQRGFAREDEANYIAYLTCRENPAADFQYSGALMALIYLLNSLQSYDSAEAAQLRAACAAGVGRDLTAISQFWQQYDGPLEKASTHVNQLFLQANRQADGVHSYNRMVDLLIAAYRAENISRP